MKIRSIILFYLLSVVFLLSWPSLLYAQELSLLEEDESSTSDRVIATFKTNRIVNGHSIETVAKNEFDFKISHRFGILNQGFYDLFGLDQATMRMGGDFGITDNINIGIGRSTVEKTYDGFIKYKFLTQTQNTESVPISAVLISHIGINTLKWAQPERDNKFTSRLHYTHQLLVARKFSTNFSAQLSPTLVHKNLVESNEKPNDIFALGFGARHKITPRTTLNIEYFHVFPNQLDINAANALSVGFDIETGGHVFQLFFTNSTAPFEKGFITDTKGKWNDGNIRFGFNIARVFNF